LGEAVTGTNKREAEVLGEVSEMIKEVIGEEWTEDTVITMETTFTFDLEVESIELIALAEKLQERYGTDVNFPVWLADKELDEIINLTVGQLVEYIASSQQ
jgi:acyl carrier protein